MVPLYNGSIVKIGRYSIGPLKVFKWKMELLLKMELHGKIEHICKMDYHWKEKFYDAHLFLN